MAQGQLERNHEWKAGIEPGGGGERPAAEGGPLVTFKQMSLALSSTFKSATLALLESLPQHQQMILCAQVLRLRAATTAAAARERRHAAHP